MPDPSAPRCRQLGVVAFAALCLASACAPQHPTPVQQASANAVAAEARFETLAKSSATSGVIPRASDPSAGPLLDAIFDTSAAAGPPSAADLVAVGQWEIALVKTGTAYLNVGTGDVFPASTNSPAAEARGNQNLLTYAPEIGRYLDASMVLGVADAADAQLATYGDPQLLQRQYPHLQYDLTRGAWDDIHLVSLSFEPNDWREARAQGLIAYAKGIAPVITAAQRQSLAQTASDAARTSGEPRVAALLTQFAAIMQAPTTSRAPG